MTLTMPKNLQVHERPNVTVKVSNVTNTDGTIDIHITSGRVALWVTLTSRAHGRFSDNAFFLPAKSKIIQFVPFYSGGSANNENHQEVLERTLRVEDFSMYVVNAGGVGRAAEER